MVKDMQTIMNFCKSRGFMYQGSDIYGGIANVWDFGPLGCRLKNNIKDAWRKRYRRQDEIGTPYCITIDYDTDIDNCVTIRNRDTMEQERIKIEKICDYIQLKLKECNI